MGRALAACFACAAPALAAQGPGFHLLETTIGDVEAAFQSGQLSCHAFVNLYVKRIDAYEKAGPKLNAVQIVNPNALAEADRLDAALKSSGPANSWDGHFRKAHC